MNTQSLGPPYLHAHDPPLSPSPPSSPPVLPPPLPNLTPLHAPHPKHTHTLSALPSLLPSPPLPYPNHISLCSPLSLSPSSPPSSPPPTSLPSLQNHIEPFTPPSRLNLQRRLADEKSRSYKAQSLFRRSGECCCCNQQLERRQEAPPDHQTQFRRRHCADAWGISRQR